VGREAAFGQRRAHVHAEFIPLVESEHGADHQYAARALVVMGARPHLAPGCAGDEVLEFFRERRLLGVGAVDPGIAQDFAPLRHPAIVAFAFVHCATPRYWRKLSTAFVKACGCSTLEMWAASSATSLAPGIAFAIVSPAAGGVAGSCAPTMTKVGAVIVGLLARKSISRTAATQAA